MSTSASLQIHYGPTT